MTESKRKAEKPKDTREKHKAEWKKSENSTDIRYCTQCLAGRVWRCPYLAQLNIGQHELNGKGNISCGSSAKVPLLRKITQRGHDLARSEPRTAVGQPPPRP